MSARLRTGSTPAQVSTTLDKRRLTLKEVKLMSSTLSLGISFFLPQKVGSRFTFSLQSSIFLRLTTDGRGGHIRETWRTMTFLSLLLSPTKCPFLSPRRPRHRDTTTSTQQTQKSFTLKSNILVCQPFSNSLWSIKYYNSDKNTYTSLNFRIKYPNLPLSKNRTI